MFGRTDLEKEDILVFETFHKTSFYFPYLLNYSSTLRSGSDLGDLWFREFFLEATKCIQFPIEMSIPWILTEHVITNQVIDSPPMIENLLYTMDIYNDSAQRALFVLNQQFLYDEIEAEANLVLDQMIFLLSDEMYKYYKNFAASFCLEKSFKLKLEEIKGSPHLTVDKRRYEIPLAQRHIQLLGRSVDLSFLVGQHMNTKLVRDIDIAIKRFESVDACGIAELRTVFEILRRTHEALSEQLEIDSFDDMLGEVDESFAPTSFRGRISAHLLRSLTGDVFPNFSYNAYTQRFVRSPISIRPIEYQKAPKKALIDSVFGPTCAKAYEMFGRLSRGFFGRTHLESFFALVGSIDLNLIVEECMRVMSEKMQDVGAYVEALTEGIPPCMLPNHTFQNVGTYVFFEGKLRSLLEYDDLKPEVFQNFREIGNNVAFLRDLSELLEVCDQFRFMNASPFLGIVPDTKIERGENITEHTPIARTFRGFTKALEKSPSAFEGSILKDDVVKQLPDLADRLVSTLVHTLGSHSLFKTVLQRIDDLMFQLNLRSEWEMERSNSSCCIDVENSKGFHRLWASLSFLFNLYNDSASSPVEGEEAPVADLSDEDEFGHGFSLAGCLFIHLLDQRAAFELMNFSYHVLNVHSHQVLTVSGTDSESIFGHDDRSLIAETSNFILNAAAQRQLQNEFFAIFEAQCPRPVSKTAIIRRFHPPVNDDLY